MNAVEIIADPAFAGSCVHLDSNCRLRKSVTSRTNKRFEVERWLWEARAEDPTCLPTYYAIYKFYLKVERFNDAARVLRLALTEAARQGGFHPAWSKLNLTPGAPDNADLSTSEAGRFYLLALKALAFTRLRQHDFVDAESILTHLARLNPLDCPDDGRDGRHVETAPTPVLEAIDRAV
jgi:hypothetical protein